MIKCIRCVVILICCLKVNGNDSSSDSSHSPTLVDKLISDYFDTASNLWSLIENRMENVLEEVKKRLSNIQLAGEDDVHMEISIEDIDKNEYGKKISDIMGDIGYTYYPNVKDSSEFIKKIIEARNLTTVLFGTTSLAEFWDAALEAAKVVNIYF